MIENVTPWSTQALITFRDQNPESVRSTIDHLTHEPLRATAGVQVTLPGHHVTPSPRGDPVVAVPVDEEVSEPAQVEVDLGGDRVRPHPGHGQRQTAIDPRVNAVGNRRQRSPPSEPDQGVWGGLWW